MKVKKLLTHLFYVGFLFASLSAFGQAGDYTFSISTSSYTPLGVTATHLPGVEADFASDDAPIGFDFVFEGNIYDSVSVASDGFISFVVGSSAATTNDLDNGSSVRRPLAAPLWDDLDGRANTSYASYETSGSAPNRVFTFEWRDWEWRYNSSDSVVSFQVKLFETTNAIEFHYDFVNPGGVNSPSASIGLSGATTFLSVYDTSATPVVSNLTEYSTIDSVVTNRVFTFTPPSCIAPSNGSFTFVGTDSVEIGWNSLTPAGPFEIAYGAIGFDPNSGGSVITSNNDTSGVGGLVPGSNYEFYIRLDCGGGSFSSWAGPFSVGTLCLAQSVPFTETFNSNSPTQVCWTVLNANNDGDAWNMDYTSNPLNGDEVAAIYTDFNGGSNDDWLISPAISLTGNEQLTYSYRVQSASEPNDFEVLLSTTGSNPADFTDTIVPFASYSNTSYQEQLVDLSSFTGDVFIAWHVPSGGLDGWRLYIDSVSVEVIPTCVEPTAGGFTYTSADSVVFGWTNGSSTGVFNIEFGPTGFTQGTNAANLITTNSDTLGFGNLAPGTTYDFYVREDCGGGDVSTWAGPFSVGTLCLAQSVPFTETFNSNSPTQVCWTVLNANNDGDAWNMDYTSNPLNGDEVAAIYTDFNGGSNDDWLISPAISLTGNEQLTYSYRVQSASEPNDFEVLLSTTGSNPADFTDTIVPFASYSNTSYQEQLVDLSSYTGDVFIAWHVPSGGLDGWRLYIDSVSVEAIPACVEPMTLLLTYNSTDSVQIAWDSVTNAYNVEYGISGFAPNTGQGTTLAVTDTFANISGLSANTAYDFYVTSDCSGAGGGLSIPGGPLTVNTLCNALPVPFTETFNSTSLSEACWTVLNANADGDQWNLNYTSNTLNGDEVAAIYTDFNGGSNDDWLISPALSLTGNEQLAYYYRVQSSGEPNDFEVLVSTTGTNPADFTDTIVPLASYSNITYQRETVNMALYSGATYIAWHIPPGGLDGWRLYIDSVVVETLPPCPDPSQLTANNITAFQADLGWTNPNATSWNVEVVPAGFGQGSGTTVNTSNNPYTATNLSPNTCYDYYVQQDCGSNGTSQWVGPFTFCTPPTCPAPTNLGVDFGSLTSNGTDIFWTTGGASDWNVQYDTAGFSLGTGTQTSSTNDTLSLSSLTPGTEYEFYVRDSCGVGDVSSWAGPFSFSTPCLPFTAPYAQNFDGAAAQDPFGGISCWTITGPGANDIELNDSPDFGVDPAPSLPNSVELNDGNFSGGDTAILVSPRFSDLSSGNNRVRFKAAFENVVEELFVGVMSNPNIPSTMVILDTITTSTAGVYREYTVNLNNTSVIGTAEHVIFVHGTDIYEVYIDDFFYEALPTCLAPTALGVKSSITTTSAEVFWTTGGASNWNVQYGPIGFSLGTGTKVQSTNDTLLLSNLAPGTEYEFYVRDSCNAMDTSSWAGPVSFITAFNTNYLDDFTLSSPFAWSEADGRLSNNTVFTSSSSSWGQDNFGNTGSSSQRVNLFTDNQFEWLISPSIYLDPSISNLQVEFDVSISEFNSATQGYLDGTDDTLALVISTDNGVTWSSTDILWYTDVNDTIDVTGEHVVIPLSAYSGYVKFGFYGGSVINDSPDNDIYVDNFEVRTPRACNTPVLDSVTAVTTSSATVHWTDGDVNASSWDVILTTSGQTPGQGVVTTLSSSGSYSFSNLTDATAYCIYLVETCPNGISDTAGPLCFNTLCLTQALPYVERFDFSLRCFSVVDSSADPASWQHLPAGGSANATGDLDGTGYMIVDSDEAGSVDMDEYAYSPVIDASVIPTGEQLFVEFHQFFRVYTLGGFEIGEVEVWDGNAWNSILLQDQSSGDQGAFSAPDTVKIDITQYANASLQVRFHYYGANFDWWWAIDNFSVYTEAPGCADPGPLTSSTPLCDEVTFNIASNSNNSIIEFGSGGFPVGTGAGTIIPGITSTSHTLGNLLPATTYDAYIADICGSDTSNWVGPFTFTTDTIPAITAGFSFVQTTTTANNATVDFDASASVGATSYTWDFGNGNGGIGVNATTTYSANQVYNVKLIVEGPCGAIDSLTQPVTVTGISLEENRFDATVSLYPNPSKGIFYLNVGNTSKLYNVEITDLSGRVVFRAAELEPRMDHMIQLSGEAAGMYLLKIKGEGLRMNQRIILDK